MDGPRRYAPLRSPQHPAAMPSSRIRYRSGQRKSRLKISLEDHPTTRSAMGPMLLNQTVCGTFSAEPEAGGENAKIRDERGHGGAGSLSVHQDQSWFATRFQTRRKSISRQRGVITGARCRLPHRSICDRCGRCNLFCNNGLAKMLFLRRSVPRLQTRPAGWRLLAIAPPQARSR